MKPVLFGTICAFFHVLMAHSRTVAIALLCFLLGACSRPEQSVRIRVVTGPLPQDSQVFLTGNRSELGSLLMSDGFPEMFNNRDETIRYARAHEIFQSVGDRSPQEIIERLARAGEAWADGRSQNDDVTFVVLKVK